MTTTPEVARWAFALHDRGVALVVDVTGEPEQWMAWWSIGAAVVGVCPADPGHLPFGVIGLVGDHRDPTTVLRVFDQVAQRPVDALVVHEDQPADAAYLPLLRVGGVTLVRRVTDTGVTFGVVEEKING